MSNKENQYQSEKIKKIIIEAWDNDTFLNELKNNPKRSIEKFLGEKINTTKKIKIIDKTDPETVYITIPKKPILNDIELSENQLEKVAGGG